MKRIITSLLILFHLSGCSPKSSSTEEANSITFQEGLYVSLDHYGHLAISEVEPEAFRFTLKLSAEDGLCRGEISGAAKRTNRQYTASIDSCVLSFAWKSDTLAVSESGRCSHGATCSFAGMYMIETTR